MLGWHLYLRERQLHLARLICFFMFFDKISLPDTSRENARWIQICCHQLLYKNTWKSCNIEKSKIPGGIFGSVKTHLRGAQIYIIYGLLRVTTNCVLTDNTGIFISFKSKDGFLIPFFTCWKSPRIPSSGSWNRL